MVSWLKVTLRDRQWDIDTHFSLKGQEPQTFKAINHIMRIVLTTRICSWWEQHGPLRTPFIRLQAGWLLLHIPPHGLLTSYTNSDLTWNWHTGTSGYAQNMVMTVWYEYQGTIFDSVIYVPLLLTSHTCDCRLYQ